MEITGKLKTINETQTFGSNEFRKREIVVTTDDQYPQMLLIEFIQDKCDLLNTFQAGQYVKVSINLRGREWINPEGKAVYFNSIQGWRIEAQDAPKKMYSGEQSNPEPGMISHEQDDLPY